MKSMFLSVVVLASINKGQVFVEHPEIAFKTNAIFGKHGTETPVGVYVLEKAFSTRLNKNILIFRKDEDGVFAIHPVVDVKGQNRQARLQSVSVDDNRISNGCINISQEAFEKLWNTKQNLILQVY
jgi:L,D-transpeptidase catalytic domain